MSKGSQIRKRREELGMSQTDLAEKVGISKQTLYKYENDIVTNIPSDKIEMIAQILHVSPSYIMGWTAHDIMSGDFIVELSPSDSPDERIKRALRLYNIYAQAPQSVRDTVDMILKSSQHNP